MLYCSTNTSVDEAFREWCFLWESGASAGADFDLFFNFQDHPHARDPPTHQKSRKLSPLIAHYMRFHVAHVSGIVCIPLTDPFEVLEGYCAAFQIWFCCVL